MFIVTSIAAVFLTLTGSNPAVAAEVPLDLPPLPLLLERLDRVAGLYRSGALDFTCVESVRVNRRRKGTYDYIYKVTDGKLEDHHISRELGKGSELLAAPRGVPDGIARPSLWTGLFYKVRQPHIRYAISGREVVLGRPTLRVTFEPAPGKPIIKDVNDWIGTAWIDAETYQVIKVVARDAARYADYRELLERHERELQRYEEAMELREKGEPRPEAPRPLTFEIATYSSWFGYVKNGMRFPTQVRTERRRYLLPGEDVDDPQDGYRVFLVVQSFDKYRFFGVRSEEQVTGIVFGRDRRTD